LPPPIKVGIAFQAMRRQSSRAPEPSILDMLTIAEAAKILGVSEPTLRRWDRAKKFRPVVTR